MLKTVLAALFSVFFLFFCVPVKQNPTPQTNAAEIQMKLGSGGTGG